MITSINRFKILLEAKKSDKQYKKEVALYKFFVVNTKTKKIESGWEFKDDAKDALSDFDGDKNYKILSELQLKKLGIDNPKQKWINESSKNKINISWSYGKENREPGNFRFFINDSNNSLNKDQILKKYPNNKKLKDLISNIENRNDDGIGGTLIINESNDSVRTMSFTIPEKKNWIEMGENLGIKYMGKTYWIKPNNKSFFEENIGNSIKFKYSLDSMYIEFPTVLKTSKVNEDRYDNMDQTFIKVKELMNKTIEFLKINKIPILKVKEPTYDYDGTIDINDILSINFTLDLKLSLTIDNSDDIFIITTPTTDLRKLLKNIKEYL